MTSEQTATQPSAVPASLPGENGDNGRPSETIEVPQPGVADRRVCGSDHSPLHGKVVWRIVHLRSCVSFGGASVGSVGDVASEVEAAIRTVSSDDLAAVAEHVRAIGAALRDQLAGTGNDDAKAAIAQVAAAETAVERARVAFGQAAVYCETYVAVLRGST